MNYPLFLARKISLSSGGKKSSPAIRVAITAVALSIAVMLASVAVVLGFQREIRDKVVGFNSHITINAMSGEEDNDVLVSLSPSLTALLDTLPYVKDYALDVSMPAIMKTQDNFKGIYLRALEGAHLKEFLSKNLEEGTIPQYADSASDSTMQKILISRIAARQLGLKVGDKIDTYFINDDVRVRRLQVSGIFNSHFDNYDDLFVYGSLPFIQQLGGLKPYQGTGIHLSVNDFDRIEEHSQSLQNALVDAYARGIVYKLYRVDNASQQGAGYFRWLELLDTNVMVIIILMTFVACVTLISGMLILILDKKNFIGLLRALGAPGRKVRRVFVYMAMRVAFTGMIIGNALMLALLWAQDKFHLLPLDAEAYYIDFVPVDVRWQSVVILNLAVMAIIYLALILPSWFASRISPAQTMRAE